MRERIRQRREWATAMVIFTAALCFAGGAALAEPPQASCSATLAGPRVLVDIELERFLDVELLKLVRLGLEGRFRFELRLLRTRPFWFDETAGQAEDGAVLRYARDRQQFEFEGRAVEDPVRLSVARIAVRPGERPQPGAAYRVEVVATLQVVTPDSLGQVAAWIAGRARSGEDSSDLSRRLLQVVAEDLARRASAVCEVRQVSR